MSCVNKWMKFIFIVFGGYFFYINPFSFAAQPPIHRDALYQGYKTMLDKALHSPVTGAEVQQGANMLVVFLCSDESLQAPIGRTVAQCLDTYRQAKNDCEKRYFPVSQSSQNYSEQEQVVDLVSRYRRCVGVK